MNSFKKRNITIVGAGYVGMSLATMLSQDNNVLVYDINQKKINLIKEKKSPIEDPLIKDYLATKKLNIKATSNLSRALNDSSIIIIATPTNYSDSSKKFDTSIVDNIVAKATKANKEALIVIKSTIPVGHTSFLQNKYNSKNIIFSPEFLREGYALQDNLFPSRIVIGSSTLEAKFFAKILKKACRNNEVDILYVNSEEAEAIKLFSNTYLAMRISFFNELDSFAAERSLNSHDVIKGVCLDERIGNYYNNPSFGYGGYCLPKDSKQLLSNFEQIPQNLMKAIVTSNQTRKNFIVHKILETDAKLIGIYKLEMKKNSDNYRDSAIIDIIKKLKEHNVEVIIYDPSIKSTEFENCRIINDLKKFKSISNIIVVNRMHDELISVKDKCFTRDIFGKY